MRQKFINPRKSEWVYCIQNTYVADEPSDRITSASDKRCPLHEHSPVLNERLLRGGVRLQDASAKYEARLPVARLVKLHSMDFGIKEYHLIVWHMVLSPILNNVCKIFWIENGRTTVKQIIFRCFIRKWKISTSEKQLVVPLPAVRLAHGQWLFSEKTASHFGPVIVKICEALENRCYTPLTSLGTRTACCFTTLLAVNWHFFFYFGRPRWFCGIHNNFRVFSYSETFSIFLNNLLGPGTDVKSLLIFYVRLGQLARAPLGCFLWPVTRTTKTINQIVDEAVA